MKTTGPTDFEQLLRRHRQDIASLQQNLGALRAPKLVHSAAMPDPTALRPGSILLQVDTDTLVRVSADQTTFIPVAGTGGGGTGGTGLTLADLENGNNDAIFWDADSNGLPTADISRFSSPAVYNAARATSWVKIGQVIALNGESTVNTLELTGIPPANAAASNVDKATATLQTSGPLGGSPHIDLIVEHSTRLAPSDLYVKWANVTGGFRFGLYLSIPATLDHYDYWLPNWFGERMLLNLSNPAWSASGNDAYGWATTVPASGVAGRAPTYV